MKSFKPLLIKLFTKDLLVFAEQTALRLIPECAAGLMAHAPDTPPKEVPSVRLVPTRGEPIALAH